MLTAATVIGGTVIVFAYLMMKWPPQDSIRVLVEELRV